MTILDTASCLRYILSNTDKRSISSVIYYKKSYICIGEILLITNTK